MTDEELRDRRDRCRHEWTDIGGYVCCAKCGGGRECRGWKAACTRFDKQTKESKNTHRVLDALELQAWRFLALHRVGTLGVSHVQFIDAEQCRINTPSTGEFYESACGATFGEAAIKLAVALGMPCPLPCDAEPSGPGVGTSSAPIATPPAGVSVPTSPATQRRRTGSTTGATGAGPATVAAPALPGGQRKKPRV